ncbi:MAG: hypothetical protein IH618_10385 [Ignavibacteriaceae bacterium]|nr:hypothetical protein [Ignavibacteriaceae bacterium]
MGKILIQNFSFFIFLLLFILFTSCSNEDNSVSPQSDLTIRGIAVGIEGTILCTTDFGDTWLLQKSGTQQTLRSIAFRNSKNIIIVGDSGIVLHTYDGGNNWIKKFSGKPERLNGVLYFGRYIWIAVGNNGTILRSTNDGGTWSNQISGAEDYDINDITRSSGDTLIAVVTGGFILRSTDIGITWTMKRPSVAHLTAIDFVDANNGMAVGWNGEVLKTSDSGQSWKHLPSGTIDYIMGISFLNTDKIIAIANYDSDNGKCLTSTNGGMDWTTRYSGSNGLYALSFADTVYGVAVGLSGTIFRTTDGGVHWKNKFGITNSWLYGMCFSSSK